MLFVYGTLQRRFGRHKYLQAAGARFASRATVRGRLYDLGEFPGALPAESPVDLVSGEVYRLPHSTHVLKVLDEIEGAQQLSPQFALYRREIVTATLENRTQVDAWIYWLNRWHGPKRRIASGDYAKFCVMSSEL